MQYGFLMKHILRGVHIPPSNGSIKERAPNIWGSKLVSTYHMMNAMSKVLRDYIPEVMMPFLDDIPMKGCATEEKDETMDDRGCRKFVVDHIRDCEKVL